MAIHKCISDFVVHIKAKKVKTGQDLVDSVLKDIPVGNLVLVYLHFQLSLTTG